MKGYTLQIWIFLKKTNGHQIYVLFVEFNWPCLNTEDDKSKTGNPDAFLK